MTPGACAAITACGNAPKGWASVSAGDTSPGVANVPRTAAPATASCKRKKPQELILYPQVRLWARSAEAWLSHPQEVADTGSEGEQLSSAAAKRKKDASQPTRETEPWKENVLLQLTCHHPLELPGQSLNERHQGSSTCFGRWWQFQSKRSLYWFLPSTQQSFLLMLRNMVHLIQTDGSSHPTHPDDSTRALGL